MPANGISNRRNRHHATPNTFVGVSDCMSCLLLSDCNASAACPMKCPGEQNQDLKIIIASNENFFLLATPNVRCKAQTHSLRHCFCRILMLSNWRHFERKIYVMIAFLRQLAITPPRHSSACAHIGGFGDISADSIDDVHRIKLQSPTESSSAIIQL